jgi:hypothetical protein
MATRDWRRRAGLGGCLTTLVLAGVVGVLPAPTAAPATLLISSSTPIPAVGGGADTGVVATAVLRARHSLQDAGQRRTPRSHHHQFEPWSASRRGRSGPH